MLSKELPSKVCRTCQFGENPPEGLGGRVFETKYFRVEHAVGPVSEGSMVLALKRHVEDLDELEELEADELGKMMRLLTGAIKKVTQPDRVYISM